MNNLKKMCNIKFKIKLSQMRASNKQFYPLKKLFPFKKVKFNSKNTKQKKCIQIKHNVI